MSEEEIKAVEKVKEVIRIDKERRIVTLYDEKPLFRDQLQIIIDLINKQQKEIEEMREELQMYVDIQNNDIHNYISKDKIKELKEKVEKEMISNPYDFSYMINELLEDNIDEWRRKESNRWI